MLPPEKTNRLENNVKKILSEGGTAWGASLADASELLAKFTLDAGVDFLWVDTEHRPYGADKIKWIPILCRLQGRSTVVRVAGLDPQLIKKALDVGANTIMVPQVNSAEEARLGVEYAKYPPQGTRGISPLWNFYLDVSYDEYLPAANDETCVIVQTETLEGINNVEAIAEVEGVDVVFAGPLDSSAALGQMGNIGHPEVQKFLEEFPRRVEKTGKASGITFFGFDDCYRAYNQGYRFIAVGNLASYGKVGLQAYLTKLRELEKGRTE